MQNHLKKYLIFLQIFSTLIFLSNCSFNKQENKTQLSDTEIYSKGLTSLQKGDFEKANLEFDEVFINYPFSSLASKSEVMSAYSLYENNNLQKAIVKLNNFIEMNPKGVLTQYAHYLLAMCYYSQVSSEGRDPSLTKEALNNFRLIATKYPNTKYGKDSKLKIQYLENTIARNELNIGKFYLKKGAPASSIKRFKFILRNFENTSVIPETLYRLTEALLLIGLKEEAIKSSAILTYNFSDNKWSKLSKRLFKNKINYDQMNDSNSSIIDYFKNIFE
jgi:outer membrane protein assembly factor BamD